MRGKFIATLFFDTLVLLFISGGLARTLTEPLRQVKYLYNTVEQDHRRVKRLAGPGLGIGNFWTARQTLAGYEAMAMIRKGQVQNIDGSDIRAQAEFISGLFHLAACDAPSSSPTSHVD